MPARIARVWSTGCAFLPLLAIIPAWVRFVSLRSALRAIIVVETARLTIIAVKAAWLAVIALKIARWPVVAVETALRAIIALEAARCAVIAARIVVARWWPVVGVARILTRAGIVAFGSGLVVPALIILPLVKFAHTRLEGARA